MHLTLKVPDYSIPTESIFLYSTPSHGNVGQLCTDCMIATLAAENKIRLVGYCHSSLVYPMTGHEEYCAAWGTSVCMPIEVYSIPSTPYVILHQRAPCISGKEILLATEILSFLQGLKYRHLFVLCGSTTSGLNDEILQRGRFFQYNTPVAEKSLASQKEFSKFLQVTQSVQNTSRVWIRTPTPTTGLVPNDSDHSNRNLMDENSLHFFSPVPDATERYEIDGAEIASRVMDAAADCDSVTCFGRYCDEGNNLGDGIDFVRIVCAGLCIWDNATVKLKFPKSFSTLFGRPITDESTLF